jgi:hypothetical protein
MKIAVKEGGKRKFILLFPSGLVFNSFTSTCAAGIINHSLRENGITKQNIPAKMLRKLSRTIIKYKRKHRGWNLVEVESKDGDNVIVRL